MAYQTSIVIIQTFKEYTKIYVYYNFWEESKRNSGLHALTEFCLHLPETSFNVNQV